MVDLTRGFVAGSPWVGQTGMLPAEPGGVLTPENEESDVESPTGSLPAGPGGFGPPEVFNGQPGGQPGGGAGKFLSPAGRWVTRDLGDVDCR